MKVFIILIGCSFKSLFLLLFLLYNPTFSQTNNSISTGSTNRLSVSLSNTMGVSTTADSLGNVDINNEANLVILPGSEITESFDSEGEGVTGEFIISPNGANFSIQGLQAENKYLIGEGTSFKSKMTNKEDGDPEALIKASASSQLVHSMTLTVDQSNTSFTQAFSSAF